MPSRSFRKRVRTLIIDPADGSFHRNYRGRKGGGEHWGESVITMGIRPAQIQRKGSRPERSRTFKAKKKKTTRCQTARFREGKKMPWSPFHRTKDPREVEGQAGLGSERKLSPTREPG